MASHDVGIATECAALVKETADRFGGESEGLNSQLKIIPLLSYRDRCCD